MKYDDDHSRRKAAIEDALNAAAGDDEIARLRSELGKALATCAVLEHTSAVTGEDQIKGLGKAAYEAWKVVSPGRRGYFQYLSWRELVEDDQLAWVAAAKAVLKAAGRVE